MRNIDTQRIEAILNTLVGDLIDIQAAGMKTQLQVRLMKHILGNAYLLGALHVHESAVPPDGDRS